VNSKVLGVSELKYTIRIFNGSKGVATATKFMQTKNSQNCTFNSVQEIKNFFLRIVEFWGQRLEVCYLNF